MNRTYPYIFLLLAFTGLFAGCARQQDIPDLNETFSKADKKPFGGYIAYQQMESMFNHNTIRDKKQPFDKTWNQISDTSSLYVCIAPHLFVTEEEAKAMLDYVYAGNSLFIAANHFDTALLNEIKCRENYTFPLVYFGILDSFRTTSVKSRDNNFSYYYDPFKTSFSFDDTVFTKVLGVNEHNDANFIVVFHGKGKLFLHCEPKAFSNYFLLKNDNYRYMQNSFAYTAGYPDHLYWDDYYWKLSGRTGGKGGALAEILSHIPLAWAFWLIVALLLLYIFFGGKRRQRIIDKLKPNENTTVTFTETIGRLYLQKKDNKNIAEKMSTYFNEYIRNNYFLNTNAVNDDFITTLSRKSGVDRGKVESLYRAIQHVQNTTAVDDYQLLSLNEQIQNFYKKS